MRLTLRSRLLVTAVVLCGTALTRNTASAQAYGYPSMQVPQVAERDYTAAITATNGTNVLFQWREGISPLTHLQLDAGIGDPVNSSSLLLFVGGSFGHQLARATSTQPLDLLVTAGAGAAFGGGFVLLRVPVGLSVGHRFELENNFAITPYVHPRLSFDACASCSDRINAGSEASLNFDIGASVEVNPNFAVRGAASFSGSELAGRSNSVAVGITWTPMALKKK